MAAPASGGDEPFSEINIVPFVDIVLVLLIIFMLTAPAMFDQSIPLELPQAATGEAESGTDVGITVLADGGLLLNGDGIDKVALRQAVRDKENVRALISADNAAPHGYVVGVIDLLRQEGVEKYAINVAPAEEDQPEP